MTGGPKIDPKNLDAEEGVAEDGPAACFSRRRGVRRRSGLLSGSEELSPSGLLENNRGAWEWNRGGGGGSRLVL